MEVVCAPVITVDGFIADSNHLTVSGPDDWAIFEEEAKRYNNFVIGRGTNKKGSLDQTDCEYKVMVSSSPYEKPGFIHAWSPEDVIKILQDRVETIYLIGGGTLNGSFARAGLIDELRVTILPRVLGSGVKLFGDNSVALDLELTDQQKLDSGSVRIFYKVKK